MTDFISLLRDCDALIGYVPLPDEPVVSNFLEDEGLMPLSEVVPKDKDSDPFLVATELTKRYADSDVCIFLPGRLFDFHGNRKGRGGGWYDRFLSLVPSAWVRIGVARSSDVVSTLVPEQWDEPVDYVLIYNGSHWSEVKTGRRPLI